MFSYFGKRSFEMMEDGRDDLLSQAVNRNQRGEIGLGDGLDHILSQSLDMFEENFRRFWMAQSSYLIT